MAKTFYRFHWADCPPPTADNAWSALWGAERSHDGTQTLCSYCGNGQYGTDPADCRTCDGTGWEDALRGYSCFDNPQQLAAYFTQRGEPADDDGQVIVFTGRQTDTGFDGEPCAVPDQIVHTMTWTQFKNTLIAPEGERQ